MCRRQRAIALSDCQQPVLAHVSGHPDATENATEHVLGLVRVDSAVAVKAENTRYLPAAAEFAALRKSGGIEIGGMLGEAQRVGAVRAGTHPPLSTDSQYAHQHFLNQAPTEVRFCLWKCWCAYWESVLSGGCVPARTAPTRCASPSMPPISIPPDFRRAAKSAAAGRCRAFSASTATAESTPTSPKTCWA